MGEQHIASPKSFFFSLFFVNYTFKWHFFFYPSISFPSFFTRKVRKFYEETELFEECQHFYEFKVGTANCVITHLVRGAEIAPLEWNFKSSPG